MFIYFSICLFFSIYKICKFKIRNQTNTGLCGRILNMCGRTSADYQKNWKSQKNRKIENSCDRTARPCGRTIQKKLNWAQPSSFFLSFFPFFFSLSPAPLPLSFSLSPKTPLSPSLFSLLFSSSPLHNSFTPRNRTHEEIAPAPSSFSDRVSLLHRPNSSLLNLQIKVSLKTSIFDLSRREICEICGLI